jgi:Putative MetA-pathway of phenol degradation
MKRAFLVLTMLLFPVMLFAQGNDANLAHNQQNATTTAAASAATSASTSDDAAPTRALFADASPANPTLAMPSPQASTSGAEAPSRPPIQGSMVGYIDDPIVESQIRIRFDGGFNDQFPDRAEFFYGKCGCYRGAELDPKAPGPPPGSNVVLPTNLNFQQLYLDAEFAPVRRFSLFAEVPFRWIQAQGLITPPANGPFPNEGGVSDVMAGFKFAAIASDDTYVTFQFRGYFPSGDASKGLGTNHYSVEPELLLYHRFSPALTLEGQVGDWHPIDGSGGVSSSGTPGSEGFAGDVFIWGIGPSYKVVSTDHVQIAPVLEFVGWTVLSGFQTNVVSGKVAGVADEVSGTNIVNIKIGVRTNIGRHSSFYIGYGHALTSADWYDQIVRAEFRYAF